MSELVEANLPCPNPECGSSDAYATYDDGHGYCFSCTHHTQGDTDDMQAKQRAPRGLGLIPESDIYYSELPRRHLRKSTLAKYSYGIATHKGETVHVANYHDEKGAICAQKIRTSDKGFTVLGDLKRATLFGQNLWGSGGRRVVITEGEVDCLSVAQAQGLDWPTLSVPNGAAGAKKAIQKQLTYLSSFDEVVLFFDNDDAGRAAVESCVGLFAPGKVKVATAAPHKDPNEVLAAEGPSALLKRVWNASSHSPAGIVRVSDVIDAAISRPARGVSYPWPALDDALFGMCEGDIIAIGAGTGVGKSDLMAELAMHLMQTHGQQVGVLFLEQQNADTVRRIAGKMANKPLHVPDSVPQSELEAACRQLEDIDKLVLFDHFGVTDWEDVKVRIRFMVAGGCKFIMLDHLTALAAAAEDERKALEKIMAELGGLVQELNFTLIFVSHLATPEGKPHEEGGRVAIRHFKGSRAIGFWSTHMIGLERNQQAEDPEERATTTLRVLKDRRTGRGTGTTLSLTYNYDTGRLSEGGSFPIDDAF